MGVSPSNPQRAPTTDETFINHLFDEQYLNDSLPKLSFPSIVHQYNFSHLDDDNLRILINQNYQYLLRKNITFLDEQNSTSLPRHHFEYSHKFDPARLDLLLQQAYLTRKQFEQSVCFFSIIYLSLAFPFISVFGSRAITN